MFRIIRETYFHRERVKCLFSLCSNLLFDYGPFSNFQSATCSGGLWLCFFSFSYSKLTHPFRLFSSRDIASFTLFWKWFELLFTFFCARIHGIQHCNFYFSGGGSMISFKIWKSPPMLQDQQGISYPIVDLDHLCSAQSQVEWVAGRRKHAESGLWRA